MKNNVRVGLLAYGAIGHEHNVAVQGTAGLELTAVCDTNPERVTAALELAPNATPFSDATAMLDSGLIDLVVVSTPPNSHYAWAKEALSRGIHVVLEKPMALLASECDELMEIAAAKKLLMVVYQNRRYDADFVAMREVIRSGEIGEGEAFSSWNEATTLVLNGEVEHFAPVNAFEVMVNNVSQLIMGESGWCVAPEQSVRVAEILDDIQSY